MNFVPEIEPVCAAPARLPKRNPVAAWPRASGTLKVPGAAGAVCVKPAGTISESVNVPAGSPVKEKAPEASVVVVAVGPEGNFNWIVTPESPGSPASRTPLPFESLNFPPEIEPIGRFPKARPDTAWWPKSTVAANVPGAGGAVCWKPAGTVSDTVYVPNGTPPKEKLPSEPVTVGPRQSGSGQRDRHARLTALSGIGRRRCRWRR